MKFKQTVIASAVALLLSACAGGGGGSGATNPGSSTNLPPTNNTPPTSNPTPNQVPFATPVDIGTVTPLPTTAPVSAYTEIAVRDLTNTGSQNVIETSMINPRTTGYNTAGSTGANWINGNIQIFGWQNGQLVNQTSQWFAPGDNSVMGPAYVRFGDFLGNGYQGFFVPTYTDLSGLSGPGYVFLNNGNGTLTRVTIDQNGAFAHDSAVAAFTASGRPDIFTLDYGPNSVLNVNAGAGNFVKYTTTGLSRGGSSVAVGDFLSNGTTSIFVGDSGSTPQNNNQIYNYALNNATHVMNLTSAVILPPGIFDTAQFSAVQQGTNIMTHNIRALPFDFDSSGRTSLVVVQSLAGAPVTAMSAVQFLKNTGGGNFVDVTANTLVGWNYNSMASYNPQLLDLAGNGLLDIFLPVANGPGSVGSSTVLMQTADHKFVTSYANIFSAFENQTQAQQAVKGYANNANNPVGLVQGPGNNYYLINTVNYLDPNGTGEQAVYLSKLGTRTVTAQATISAIKQTWPWMTDAQANSALAATSTTWFGLNLLNPDLALSPVGSLTFNTARGTVPVHGGVGGVDLAGQTTTLTAFDSLNRSFSLNMTPTVVNSYMNSFNGDTEHIDQYELTSHTEYLISGAVNTVGGLRFGSETRNQYNTLGYNADTLSGMPVDNTVGAPISSVRNFSIGAPYLWRSGSWSGGIQYTTLNYNPWMSVSGSWGLINSTSNFDQTVRYSRAGFTAVVGATYTTTDLSPGLITQVGDIFGIWGETGYRYENFGIYAGIKPQALHGSVTASLPTRVDNNGNSTYTNKTLGIANAPTEYVRALWTTELGKNSFYRISGTVMTNGEYRVMNEFKFNFKQF